MEEVTATDKYRLLQTLRDQEGWGLITGYLAARKKYVIQKIKEYPKEIRDEYVGRLKEIDNFVEWVLKIEAEGQRAPKEKEQSKVQAEDYTSEDGIFG